MEKVVTFLLFFFFILRNIKKMFITFEVNLKFSRKLKNKKKKYPDLRAQLWCAKFKNTKRIRVNKSLILLK